MIKKEFEKLDLIEKRKVLLVSGKYFYENVNYGKSICKYYLLFDFVVEAEYEINTNKIRNIHTMNPFSFDADKSLQEPTVHYLIISGS